MPRNPRPAALHSGPDKGALCLPVRLLLPLNPREGQSLNPAQPDPPQPSSPRPASQEVKTRIAEAGLASHGRGDRAGAAWGPRRLRVRREYWPGSPETRVPAPGQSLSWLVTPDQCLPFSGPHLANTSELTPGTPHLYPASWTYLSKPCA